MMNGTYAMLHARCVIIYGFTECHTNGAERRLAQAEGHARNAADLPNRLGTTGALGRRTAMKRPTPESVSVTPAIRKPRIATAARPPAPKEQHAQFAVRNMAMLWDMILLPVGHMMITSTGSSVPVAMKRMT